MEQTPRANRIHIGIYGRCNSGKSSLINAITGQQTAVVSEVAGTTTDTVNKSMELPGVGAVTFARPPTGRTWPSSSTREANPVPNGSG